MAEDRFTTNGYKIVQSVKINGLEIVVAENLEAEKPYMMWRRSLGESFGAEKHLLPVFGYDYLQIFREFIKCQSVYADDLDLDRIYRGSHLEDYSLEISDCVPGGMDTDLKGRVIAIKAEVFSPEYRACSHQLMLATGGFGCSPNARGRAVYGDNLYSGEQERWDRSDILGVVKEKMIPAWAQEKLKALNNPLEKESVISKIREAKAVAKAQPPVESNPKKHIKSEPEL